YCARNWDYFDY
nr:immunoglobulin heavy chain junction region [Mus musculus]